MYSSLFPTSECFLQMVHVLSVVLFTMDGLDVMAQALQEKPTCSYVISFTCDVCSIWRLGVLNCLVYPSLARSREYDSLHSHWSDANVQLKVRLEVSLLTSLFNTCMS